MENNYVVIMAGGVGSRFWPYSRNDKPKQFLDVLGTGDSLLQMTYKRFLNICPGENIFISTNETYAGLVREHLPELSNDQILKEPARRNTAPCIAYASYKIAKRNPDATIVFAPSDHVIFQEDKFERNIRTALEAAQGPAIITLGIRPSRPETGYGYIQYNKSDTEEVKKVLRFTEKPDMETAERLVASGDYLWNAGIFIWKAQTIMSEFARHLPIMHQQFQTLQNFFFTPAEKEALLNEYPRCEDISIDYAVMERSQEVFVIPGEFGWSDLGTWNSLHDVKDKYDNDNNVVDANALIYDTANCFIKAKNEKLVVVQGLEGFLVFDSDDVLLVCEKDKEKQIREFVADVRKLKGEKYV
ncbi:MAG: mannose-1-phosphate guanylyltransferase [Cytophagales bacterium]|nr:mannose-1-phosphate guanylyltransferase [Cytophagales bacterium]